VGSKALDRVSLTIPDGLTCSVIGPSGCGKSTLLRVIAGLEPEYGGTVFYDGLDMAGVPPGERHIGMVFQNYALYPHFRGRGNLAFVFKIRRKSDEEIEERIRITSEIMGIGFKELLRRRPGTLSGGEQQRIAIGRAIVRKPNLFLFDEPLSNLDAPLRVQTRVELKRLLRRFQITAIYVTHDQFEAITLGDRIAVMRAGKIEQVGSYHHLRDRPANTFVAGFLGRPPMNLLEGGTVSGSVLRLGQISIPLPGSIKTTVRPDQRLTVGVRPEAVRIVSGDQPVGAGLCLRGTVEVIEPDFARKTQLVHLRRGDMAYAATGELDHELYIGAEIETIAPTDQLYFFDSRNEQLIG
jgi:ABC-type sugar transport system ATPase subunit